MPALGLDGPEGDEAPVRIAVLTFAFDNSRVIRWLRLRGTAIKNEDWNKVNSINEEIRQALKWDDDLLNKMQTPCSVFATMETEEGYQRALNYNQSLKMDEYAHMRTLLEEEIEIQPASEPTDIIWENRSFTPEQRNIKRFMMAVIVLIALALSFSIIFAASKASLAKKEKYPKVNCMEIAKNYEGRHDLWEMDAVIEFKQNKIAEDKNEDTNFSGAMQCFCQTEKTAGVSKEEIYEQKNLAGDVVYSGPICNQYFDNIIWSKIIGQSIAFIIIAVNVALKLLIINLVYWIGEDTQSQQKSSITNGVFYAQFFNTGFLLLLVNANATEHNPEFITKYMKGPYHDYMPDWYLDVGLKITQAMVINSIMPYVGVAVAFIVPKLL